MSAQYTSTEFVRRLLVDDCGFDNSLIQTDYRFGRGKQVPLAAFEHRPFDARSVCIGAVSLDIAQDGVGQYRDLGAPVMVVESNSTFGVWKVGTNVDERLQGDLTQDGLRNYIQSHLKDLQPRAIYAAKTLSRLENRDKQLQLFVEPALLPFVESKIGDELTAAVVASVNELVLAFPKKLDVSQQNWVFKAVFRLLAGKILCDKKVPGFVSLRLSQVEDVLRRVEKHYGSQDPLEIGDVDALKRVVSHLQNLGDLRNLTTESLGDVYERALITSAIRKRHGTHKTPSYLVDYIVWQLASWIAEIPLDRLRVFEPGCGHAPFLVSMIRLVRMLNPGIDLGERFRKQFFGIDKDQFALELARLSLTVADEPNPNGWIGLSQGDMFKADSLEQSASQSMVLLTNPPYESGKAFEVLRRTIPHLPVGGVFGAVVPATLLTSDNRTIAEFRRWMARHCQLGEVDLLPDGLFSFADHEVALLIGRRVPDHLPTGSFRTRIRRVRDRDQDREAFKNDYQFSTSRLFCQSQFSEGKRCSLWVPEYYREIWSFLESLPRLRSIADVKKGLEHKGKESLGNTLTVADEEFPGSIEGFASSRGNWQLHEHPEIKNINLTDDVIRRPGSGPDRLPQVLVNYHPVSRGRWRLKPFIDETGRVLLSTFLSVRPKNQNLPLQFLWALLISPLAHLYVATASSKRDIIKSSLDQFPIPKTRRNDVARIKRLVDQYFSIVKQGEQNYFVNPEGFTEADARNALMRLDAEVLRLYDLPAKSERFLLEQFRGEQRPGVPIPFMFYYPPEMQKDIPLYVFLSSSFQKWMNGGDPELSRAQMKRLLMLGRKREQREKLTTSEAAELRTLHAERDGRDYAVSLPPINPPTLDDSVEAELRVLQDRLATQAIQRETPP